jgi:hypothetical protein
VASFLSLLSTGHLVETRRARGLGLLRPTDEVLSELAGHDDVEDVDAEGPRPAARFLDWVADLDEERLFRDLPGRGLFRRTVAGELQAVYAAHREHLEDASRRAGGEPVAIPELALYLAMLRRREEVVEADTAAAVRMPAWLSGPLRALPIAGFAALSLWAGMAWPWMVLAALLPVTALMLAGRTTHGIVQLLLLGSPLWLVLVAAVVQTPPGTVPRVLILSTLCWISFFVGDLLGLALWNRVYPAISARIASPPLVPARDLEERYPGP